MTINHHIERFHGLPIFDISAAEAGAVLPDPAEVAWRVAVDYTTDDDFSLVWEHFLEAVDTSRVTAVVIGPWFEYQTDFAEPRDLIVASAERLPALRALFVGDITYEESEISWIMQADLTPLLTAFPRLEELVVRGANDNADGSEVLALQPMRHEGLRALRFEAGGLPARVLHSVAACDFPALERLEFWLGADDYGGDSTVDDLTPFLDAARYPALRHLGLQNSEYQDEIATAVAQASVVAQLESLSLSMGALTDEGAAALLDGQPLTHLRALDLHHHFLSPEMQQRVRDALPGVEIDLSKAHKPDGRWGYIAVAE